MSSIRDILARVAASGRVTPEDAAGVRAAVYCDALISADDAEALFAINDAARTAAPEWRDLFVEALVDYVVVQAHPEGYVDAEVAAWLASRIEHDGKIKSATELELLIRILERASAVPPALFRLTLAHVETYASTEERRAGNGPALTADEVALVARLIYALAGGGGGAAVSRTEAELLFRLNDAAKGRSNDPAWRDLFANAIGAHLLAAPGYEPPDREEALRRLGPPPRRYLDMPTSDVGRLIYLAEQFAEVARQDAEDARAEASKVRAAVAAEQLDEDEAAWLADRIARHGPLDENEIALLRLLAARAPAVPPVLWPLLSRAGIRIPG